MEKKTPIRMMLPKFNVNLLIFKCTKNAQLVHNSNINKHTKKKLQS